ncbi:MAG: hypothetical protein COT91_02155 [Candidatus Doudnabacteria bacterium CG10_big_fil_rev_8_21_14_0_10_41_10]|uniref:Uncharacterized protein n=1 Tax=Candidatus Doudnabacteria bacterium CG10_big_fil_rev_8_21_14_0_10_41_10 TaxID=1974551 RepID=A0A2H0VDX9_9BACT|nr:MAG: hypothetical protein COT91_02155 [Candidatus Doudnabacteria bacterium CG10_big_fil_rev_8_21_14_0_10_41_10]
MSESDDVYELCFSAIGMTREGQEVRDQVLAHYRVRVVPAQHLCPTCGQNNAETHAVEILGVFDEITQQSIGWETGVGAMVAWKICTAHKNGKPICRTPACLEDLKFQLSLTAAS